LKFGYLLLSLGVVFEGIAAVEIQHDR